MKQPDDVYVGAVTLSYDLKAGEKVSRDVTTGRLRLHGFAARAADGVGKGLGAGSIKGK